MESGQTFEEAFATEPSVRQSSDEPTLQPDEPTLQPDEPTLSPEQQETKWVQNLYEDPVTGLSTANRILQRVRDTGHYTTLNKVKQALAQLPAVEVFSKAKRPTHTSIVEKGVGKGYQMDMMDLRSYTDVILPGDDEEGKKKRLAPKNHGFKWVLMIMDIESRFAWVEATTSKGAAEVAKALLKIFSRVQNPISLCQTTIRRPLPERITSDIGTEYKGEVKILLDQLGIEHHVNQKDDHRTLGIIDRFTRTLRELINRFFVVTQKLVWVDHLQDIVLNYNTNIHGTIKEKPMEVWCGLVNSKQKKQVGKMTLLPGMLVRAKNVFATFQKPTQLWSTTVYTVVGRKGYKYSIRKPDGTILCMDKISPGERKLKPRMFRQSELLRVRSVVSDPTITDLTLEKDKPDIEEQRKIIKNRRSIKKRLDRIPQVKDVPKITRKPGPKRRSTRKRRQTEFIQASRHVALTKEQIEETKRIKQRERLEQKKQREERKELEKKQRDDKRKEKELASKPVIRLRRREGGLEVVPPAIRLRRREGGLEVVRPANASKVTKSRKKSAHAKTFSHKLFF